MCTAFTHAFVGVAAGRICFGRPMPLRFWFLAAGCSALPDLDVGLHAYGVEYGDLWGHRGMMHSFFFAAVLSPALVLFFFRKFAPIWTGMWWKLIAFFFVVIASHGFLDAFTDGGLGIAFFAPFSESRHFMPWTPLPVPHMGLRNVFTAYLGHVVLMEMLYIWAPMAIVLIGTIAVRRLMPRSNFQAVSADPERPPSDQN